MKLPPPPETSHHLLANAPVVVEVASGVDALYFSGRVPFGEGFFEDMLALRAQAEAEGCGVPVEVGGATFEVQPGPMGKYKVCLAHEHGRVGLTDSEVFPAIRVQPLARFLHAEGPQAATDWFCRVLGDAVGDQIEWTTSRVDLFVDVQGWAAIPTDRERLVGRSRHRELFFEDDELTGINVGRRSSGTVSARIYNKTLRVAGNGEDYWYEVWERSGAYDPTLPVWRIEFEFARKGLKSLGADLLADVFHKTGGMWAYGTMKWLRLCDPSPDQTRSRWPTATPWAVVQAASLCHDAVPLERLAELHSSGQVRRLMPVLNGCLAKFGAALGCADLLETVDELVGHVEEYEVWTGIAFDERLARKRIA